MLCNRLVLFVALAASPAIASACSIPVFRYALERWDSDRFQVIIYHDGALSPEQAAAFNYSVLRRELRAGSEVRIKPAKTAVR